MRFCFVGWAPALVSLWVLGHGWAAVALIQKILETFPACASIGTLADYLGYVSTNNSNSILESSTFLNQLV